MQKLEVTLPNGSRLCIAELASSLVTRGVGLLGRSSLGKEEGLMIQPCSSVHTHFMRFPIDVIYLNAEDAVVKVAMLKTFRFSTGGKGAKKVIELPYGRAEEAGVRVGDRLTVSPILEGSTPAA